MIGSKEGYPSEQVIGNESVIGESQKRNETMNDQQLETKVRNDGAKVKKDLNALMEDSAAFEQGG